MNENSPSFARVHEAMHDRDLDLGRSPGVCLSLRGMAHRNRSNRKRGNVQRRRAWRGRKARHATGACPLCSAAIGWLFATRRLLGDSFHEYAADTGGKIFPFILIRLLSCAYIYKQHPYSRWTSDRDRAEK